MCLIESDDDTDSDEEDDETGRRKEENSPSRKERDMSSALDKDVMFNERNQVRSQDTFQFFSTKLSDSVGSITANILIDE